MRTKSACLPLFSHTVYGMRIVAVVLGLATIATLDLVLLIGAGYDRPAWFVFLTMLLDLFLTTSSVVWGVAFIRSGRRLLGLLFLANLIVMLGALILRTTGVEFSRPLLFGADLYWLNLYVAGLVVLLSEPPT